MASQNRRSAASDLNVGRALGFLGITAACLALRIYAADFAIAFTSRAMFSSVGFPLGASMR